jgi:YD repeat-containing protein
LTITFDQASRITGFSDQPINAAGQSVGSPQPQGFGYDNLDRITTASLTRNAGTANPTPASFAYTYDAIGNRLSHISPEGTTTYSYPAVSPTASHRLQSSSGAASKTYTYDAAGNQSNANGTAVGAGLSGNITHTYDARGRMVASQVIQSNKTINLSYQLNALGQRIAKTATTIITSPPSTTTKTTLFAYDEAGRLIGEYTATGQAIQETLWLNDQPVAVWK